MLLGMLCFMLAITGLVGICVPTAKADVSPLITLYKPQVVNADVEASYTDADGNTITATIHHPPSWYCLETGGPERLKLK